jgi:hypothetical protein
MLTCFQTSSSTLYARSSAFSALEVQPGHGPTNTKLIDNQHAIFQILPNRKFKETNKLHALIRTYLNKNVSARFVFP